MKIRVINIFVTALVATFKNVHHLAIATALPIVVLLALNGLAGYYFTEYILEFFPQITAGKSSKMAAGNATSSIPFERKNSIFPIFFVIFLSWIASIWVYFRSAREYLGQKNLNFGEGEFISFVYSILYILRIAAEIFLIFIGLMIVWFVIHIIFSESYDRRSYIIFSGLIYIAIVFIHCISIFIRNACGVSGV